MGITTFSETPFVSIASTIMTIKVNSNRSGYTLIEILLAVTLGLILMLGVVEIFAMVGDYVHNSQAIMELDNKVRSAQLSLQNDLSRYTCKMTPPADPMAAEGYFKIEEECDSFAPAAQIGSELLNDNLLGDNNDVLRFTIHDVDNPFVGRAGDKTYLSPDAEVVWYVKGTSLYRRVNVLVPNCGVEGGRVVDLTLSDLSFTENRDNAADLATDNLILENVIQFDVKVWDPQAHNYVNLGEGQTFTGSAVFDTGSLFKLQYTANTTPQNNIINPPSSTNFEPTNNAYNGIHLDGLQIRIRAFVPSNGVIREITVEQDFTTH